MQHATTISFRVEDEFAAQTKSLAEAVGLKNSEYIRLAIMEKNQRVMTERIAALSKELASEHLVFNESIEDSLTDGIE